MSFKESDLYFLMNRICMKLFNTSDMNIIRFRQTQLDVYTMTSELLTKRTNKFKSTRKIPH